jgi:hypothetical protein
MSAPKHTPGPWLIQQGDEWADGIVTLHGHNEDGTPMYWTVASYNRRRDEAEANARLIAAAPEMLETLKAMAEGCSVPADDVQRAIRDRARAAIAKATGSAS